MQIKKVTGRNRYCGPHVISAITGIPTHEIALHIRQYSGRTQVRGTSRLELERVLEDRGFTLKHLVREKRGKGPTLAAWLNSTSRPSGKLFVVCAGWHWQLIEADNYTCAQTRKHGVSVSVDHPAVKRRARVSDVLEVA